jgi:adenylate kinase
MQLEKIILIMGAPGSGKGTQGKMLAQKAGYEYFSTGDVLRGLVKQETELGKKVKSIIDQGYIIPDELMHDIFIDKIGSIKAQAVIVDGYPRTMGQVSILEEVVSRFQIREVVVLFLDVDKDKLVQRISARTHGRADDDPSIIDRRFDEYQAKTAPVKGYYEQKGSLIEINGDQPVESVHKDILNKLGL